MNKLFDDVRKFNLWNGKTYPFGLERVRYSHKLKQFVRTKLIKVLVGQRRVGKSYLMKQLMMMLINEYNVPRQNILYINLEYLEYDFIKSYKELQQLVKHYKEQIKPEGKTYLFIDEVQNVKHWEKFVNAYAQDFVEESELFITGSNSNLLAGELASLLSGRYVKFEIFPFNYTEYLGAVSKEKNRKSFIDFIQFGGLPELFNIQYHESQKQYVSSVKDTILLRDIVNRKNIRDVRLLNDIFIYLVNNASNLVSITNLVNYFKSKKRTTSYDTIANYIGYIKEAFLIHEAERYNIKGKETIGGTSKYYVNDLSFKNLFFSGFGYGMGYLLENRVFLDLKMAGFTVYTGNWDTQEVDFVAKKDDQVLYVQSAYLLENEKTVNREYRVLEKIKDNFPKWVVSLDEHQFPQKLGIKHVQGWNFAEELGGF